MALPEVLAGPILRRAEPGRVLVWLATSVPARVRGEVVPLDGGRAPLARGGGRQVRLGERLFVHLVALEPGGDGFPRGRLLGYDLELELPGGSRRLADLGLLDGLTYGDLPLPSFFLRAEEHDLHLLHGSCRLLHGLGDDASLAADELLARTARRPGERPGALFLTGDQIYGDDVAGPLLPHLTRLGAELVGPGDGTSVPGLPPAGQIPLYGRQELAVEQLRFTSGRAANHLLTFGEHAAMYVLAWNEAAWPERLEPAGAALPGGGRARARLRRRYATEAACLERARAALPSLRRVLANVPTYMIFDDHDVTDDWNITSEWRRRVQGSPAGRRVVAGALAAYWAFQGWGNQPEHFDDAFVEAVAGGPGDRSDEALWSFDRWSYVAPTDPPALVLDTRTQREFDGGHAAARLIGRGELERVRALARGAGIKGPGPALLVSPVPVFGLEVQERRQKFLVGKVGPYDIDFEAWHSNLRGLCDFMHLLIDDLGLRRCTILSGDVHYGLNVESSFSTPNGTLAVAQVVSSSFKHSGAVARGTLHLLGALVRPEHRRAGWPSPPTTASGEPLLDRAVNTDHWADDAPVFLPPALAERIGPDQPPSYHERRRYLCPGGRRSVLVGENNVGHLALHGDRVTHHLLGRNQATHVHTVTFDLHAPDRPGGPPGG